MLLGTLSWILRKILTPRSQTKRSIHHSRKLTKQENLICCRSSSLCCSFEAIFSSRRCLCNDPASRPGGRPCSCLTIGIPRACGLPICSFSGFPIGILEAYGLLPISYLKVDLHLQMSSRRLALPLSASIESASPLVAGIVLQNGVTTCHEKRMYTTRRNRLNAGHCLFEIQFLAGHTLLALLKGSYSHFCFLLKNNTSRWQAVVAHSSHSSVVTPH